MSRELINKSATVGTTIVELYKCPADAGIVFGVSLSNNTSGLISVTMTLYSDSGGNTTDIIAPNTVLDGNESLVPIGGIQKLVLNKNDKINVSCSIASGLDVVLSALQLNDYTF